MRASRRDVAVGTRHQAWRALAVPFLTLTLAATPALSAPPAAKSAAPAPAKSAAPAPAKTAAPAPAPAKAAPMVAKSTAAPTAAKTPAAKTAAAPNVAVAANPSVVTPAHAAPKTAVQAPPSIEEQVTYQYNALGRRDPFQAMAGGTFVGDDVGGDAPPDVGGIKVVGIVWGASDKFALVEDARGSSSVLRAGDKVMNGVVETLKRDAVVVKLTVDGQTESVTIPLTRKGDQTNGNR